MANHRQRGSGVRIRSEAKAAAADRLLLAAQQESEYLATLNTELAICPKRRFLMRRKIRAELLLTLQRYHTAITAAQDIAQKGRYARID